MTDRSNFCPFPLNSRHDPKSHCSEVRDLEGSTVYSFGSLEPNPIKIFSAFENSLWDDDVEHQDNLPQTPFVDLSVDSSAKTQVLDRMETEEEKYLKWQPGKAESNLRLRRAWMVHSAWASIENVCKISSSLLVNKPQCEHIADHFKVTADVLKKLGLDKDFVSGHALEGGTGIQIELTFNEMHFSRVAETFEKHFFSVKKSGGLRLSHFSTQIQNVSRMFEDYVRELDALDGSSEDSLSKHSKVNERFLRSSLLGKSAKKNVKARSRDHEEHLLDQFLCLLLGVLKQGEDLVLFHSGLEGANNEVVQRTGLFGEKFVQIHELLYELLDIYVCLDHCEGAKFARGYLSQLDSCRAQSLLYYLNSNCLDKYGSLFIDDDILNIELATRISELLERPNIALKRLHIGSFSRVKVDNLEELRKCHLLVIAALSKCVSIRDLFVDGCNGEEVHQLCKNLSANKVLETLLISTDGPLADNNAMDLSVMLKEKHSLKNFTLKFKGISPEGAVYLGAMLAENSSLERMDLTYTVLGRTDSRHLLFISDREPWVCITLEENVSLRLRLEVPTGIAEIIAQVLSTSKTLTHFSIFCIDSNPDVACEILDSLKKNKTLQVLDLKHWAKLDDARVKQAFMDLLVNYNFSLSNIRMHGRDWDIESFIKCILLEFEHPNGIGDLGSNVGGTLESPIVRSAHDLKQVTSTHQLEKGEGSNNEVRGSSTRAFDIHKLEVEATNEWPQLFFNYSNEMKDFFAIESPPMQSANESKQVLNDLKLHKGKGSTFEGGESSMKAFEEQGELIVGHPSELEVILGDSKSNLDKAKVFGLRSKLEMESKQSLQALNPLLESIMKSTNFLLRRNLNMAQFLQERYSEGNLLAVMYPSKSTSEEKDELNKGCITAALFPTTFLYHLKARLLEGPNPGGILHTLKEVDRVVVERIKSLQDSGSQTFEFIDYVDFRASLGVHHIYSLIETIAICQTFSTKIGIGEELQVENSIQYGIVQDHVTRVYCFDSVRSSNLDKPNLDIDKSTGVIGVKVSSTNIHVEIMWEDGSYYFGPLEDFSYDHKIRDNNQCAFEAFGNLEGAHFLRTRGLKCSPLLVIALAMTIDKKGLTLAWKNGKGHIQGNSILSCVQPMELEVLECQILFDGGINQLGEVVEWGMDRLDQNLAFSSRDNQCRVFFLEHDPNQNFPISNDTSVDTWSSDESNNASNHTPNNVDLGALASQFNAGAQDKMKVSAEVKVLGSGGNISFEIQNSKGKKVEDQSFEKMQELHWKEKGGYVIASNLDVEHQSLEERLFLGSLSAEHDLNYLVVYDDYKASHVSIYWVKDRSDTPRLELKWITEIFIKGGPKRIKKIFEGLKGETLEVTRRYTEFHENSLQQQQSKGFMKWFKNQRSNKGICKDNGLQMVSRVEEPKFSNDEWKHIVGLQPREPTKFWLLASYMQAITYSRTIYSSGLLLSTYTTEKYGLKCGSAQRNFKLDASKKLVHDFDDVKSYAKFSKPPWSLSSKWHDVFHWGGFK